MASFNSTKLAIYESFDNGFIDEEEKYTLLDILESVGNDTMNDIEKQIEETRKRNKKILAVIAIVLGSVAAISVASKIKKNMDKKP